MANVTNYLSIYKKVFFYLCALVAIWGMDKLSPTDMAGPGFDLVVYFAAKDTSMFSDIMDRAFQPFPGVCT